MALPEDSPVRHYAARWDRQVAIGYRTGKLGLIVGYLSLTVAILVAHATPATGYEVSIYTATPLLFWVFAGLALLVSLVVSIQLPDTGLGSLALMLGGTSLLSIVALPLVRGYHYYGLADGLNHLAFARNMAAGNLAFLRMLYPSSHSTAVLFSTVAGVDIPRAMLLVVLVCMLVFFVFVPVTVREFLPAPRAVVLASFAGFMLMPLTNIGTVNRFHPFSLATLVSPLLLYLLVLHLGDRVDDGRLPGRLSPTSLLVPPVGMVLIMYHPQLAFDVIVIFAVFAGLQLVARWTGWSHPVARTRAVYGQAVILLGMFFAWNSTRWQASVTIRRTQQNLREYFLGGSEVAPNVQSRQESAREIGVSLTELFVKLLSVEAVFALLAGVLVVVSLLGWLKLRPETETVVTGFAVAGLVLLPYFFTQFIGNLAHHFFRHVGFTMVVVTILASVTLYHCWKRFEPHRFAQPALVVFLAVMLVLSLAALYPSPYIFRHNPHVSEQHVDGFERSFATQPANDPEPVLFRNTGLVLSRYERALAAKPGTPWYPGPVTPEPDLAERVPGSGMWNLRAHVASAYWAERSDSYLIVTAVDRKRAVVAEEGLRYSRASFAAVRDQPRVHRVHTTGQFRSYYIDLPPPPGELYNVTEAQRDEARQVLPEAD